MSYHLTEEPEYTYHTVADAFRRAIDMAEYIRARQTILFYRGSRYDLERELRSMVPAPPRGRYFSRTDEPFPVGWGGLDFRESKGWTIAAMGSLLDAIHPDADPKMIVDGTCGFDSDKSTADMYRITWDDFIRYGGGFFLSGPPKGY